MNAADMEVASLEGNVRPHAPIIMMNEYVVSGESL